MITYLRSFVNNCGSVVMEQKVSGGRKALKNNDTQLTVLRYMGLANEKPLPAKSMGIN